MFIVVERNGDNFSIKDTTDGVVETYNSSQIAKILNLGIKIQGFSIKNGKLTYTDLASDSAIAKRKFITGYDTIIFTEEDTEETAHEKIKNVKAGAKIAVINNSNITDMTNMFYYCKASEIDLSNFDTYKVTKMISMFTHCWTLESLNLSNFDTSKVTNMDNMFYYCESLTSLDLSSFDTSKVTRMNSMFQECKSLILLDVNNFDTSNVTTMESMFAGCESLTSLDISNFIVSETTNIPDMFRDCPAKLILPKTGKLANYKR